MTTMLTVGLTYFGIPLLMLLMGAIMTKFPPKKKNLWYGYRTHFAMRSEESFQFAQSFFTPPVLVMGIVSTIMSLVLISLTIFNNPAHLEAVGWTLCILYAASLFALIITTELALFSKFVDPYTEEPVI
ncbi:MAG: SdpI family protein [Bacteroidaceae bacterium]|nr:SdpI family protein [Bacteroidaceae bacterium]